MPSSLAALEAEALKLSAEDRVRLADHLLASVSDESAIEDEWAAEVERRLAEAEAGAPMVSLEEAVARARKAVS